MFLFEPRNERAKAAWASLPVNIYGQYCLLKRRLSVLAAVGSLNEKEYRYRENPWSSRYLPDFTQRRFLGELGIYFRSADSIPGETFNRIQVADKPTYQSRLKQKELMNVYDVNGPWIFLYIASFLDGSTVLFSTVPKSTCRNS